LALAVLASDLRLNIVSCAAVTASIFSTTLLVSGIYVLGKLDRGWLQRWFLQVPVPFIAVGSLAILLAQHVGRWSLGQQIAAAAFFAIVSAVVVLLVSSACREMFYSALPRWRRDRS
jgi:hypothetical protein